MNKSKTNKSKWALHTVIKLIGLCSVKYEESYILGSLLARTDTSVLKQISHSRIFPGFIKEAAKVELVLREAEKEGAKSGRIEIF